MKAGTANGAGEMAVKAGEEGKVKISTLDMTSDLRRSPYGDVCTRLHAEHC